MTNEIKHCYNRCCDSFLLQVFQLTTLVVRVPVTSSDMFVVSLDRLVVAEDEVRGALLCEQGLVKSPHFTQRKFFPDSGVAILTESAAIFCSTTTSAVYEPLSQAETPSRSQVAAEVSACVNRALDRRGSQVFKRPVVCGV